MCVCVCFACVHPLCLPDHLSAILRQSVSLSVGLLGLKMCGPYLCMCGVRGGGCVCVCTVFQFSGTRVLNLFHKQTDCYYGVATISRLLQIIGLFCRILSLS